MDQVPNRLIERLALIPSKLRERGFPWLFRRIFAEGLRFLTLVRGWILLFFRAFLWFEPNRRYLAKKVLFAYYDLDVYPISYDICWFLVWADLERKRRKRDRLHCIFVPISNEEQRRFPEGYDVVIDRNSRAWRFRNICVAATSLLSNVSVTVCEGRQHADVLKLISPQSLPSGFPPPLPLIYQRTIAGLVQEGSQWKGLSAPLQGKRYVDQWLRCFVGEKRPIVITLRQYGVDPERNSTVEEWVAFAKSLDHEIFQPVIIPDTDSAMLPLSGLDGLTIFREAAWNLGLRMALYESAYLNMFVNSGPGSLCILNRNCRYLFFKVMVPSLFLASEENLKRMGFTSGTTPPFATPFQKWVWETDNREILRREFDAMVKCIEDNQPLMAVL